MRRIEFAVVLIIGLTLLLIDAEAQLARKVPRVGFLIPLSLPDAVSGTPSMRRLPVFTQRMKELGWVEGQAFTIESRFTERDEQKLRNAALELAGLPVDVIVAVSSPAVNAASAATSTIPIIAIDLETDPVAKGFAASLARPSKNITGLFLDLPELNGKRLQLLKELVPKLSRVAVLWDPGLDPTPLKSAELAARTFSVDLQVTSASRREDLVLALREVKQKHAEALLVVQSPAFDVYAKDIATLALKYRLPSIGVFNGFARSSGLMSYGPDLRTLFVQSANYVDRILKGAQAGNLPIERPVRFEFVVNVKTAKALGLTIPQSLLVRADEIIQ
jgi:putative ABC transport system substrate-binding protein